MKTAFHLSGFIFFAFTALAIAQDELPTDPIVCSYARLPEREPFEALNAAELARTDEVEPNNSHTAAQKIPLGFGSTAQPDVDVSGEISVFDKDFFQIECQRGQMLGLAVLAVDGGQVDSLVSVHLANGKNVAENDNHQIGATKIADLYPQESPMPAGGLRRDSILTFAIPEDGTYFIRVDGNGASSGKYVLQSRLRNPAIRSEPIGTKQILFLDFDGETIEARRLFGDGALTTATLSPMSQFLSNWGFDDNQEDEVIDLIVSNVEQSFQSLLAGNTDAGIEIRNSKDHPDDFGSNPMVSRVIVGGTISELGISTIGIAECIDPGNFSTNDTAVVLLDLLSAPANNPNSVKSLKLEGGMSLEEAVARVVGAVIAHEAGHFLGCWHTENSNDVAAIMDQGGSIKNKANVGGNGSLDPSDPTVEFVHDFYANEGIVASNHIENIEARVLNALAVGQAPNPVESALATRDIIDGLLARENQTPATPKSFLNTRLSIGLETPALSSETIVEPIIMDRLQNSLNDARSKLQQLRK